MNWVKQLEMAIDIGPILVTVGFVALFVGTLVWIYRPGSKGHYRHQAQLPLEDGAGAVQHAATSEGHHG